MRALVNGEEDDVKEDTSNILYIIMWVSCIYYIIYLHYVIIILFLFMKNCTFFFFKGLCSYGSLNKQTSDNLRFIQ